MFYEKIVDICSMRKENVSFIKNSSRDSGSALVHVYVRIV